MGNSKVKQYPVILEVMTANEGLRVRATTSIERALDDAKSLQEDLRCIELDYSTTLTAVNAALAAGRNSRSRDPRPFWYAGKYLSDFITRLNSHGFYLVKKNITPAEHLGISRASVEKMMAFYRRYPDPFKINASVPWSTYRDNKEASDRRVARCS